MNNYVEIINKIKKTAPIDNTFEFPELQFLFSEDMSQNDLYDLICFEKQMFKIKDNSMSSHSHMIHKNYPYLTNSFNVYQEIFDFNP